MRSELLMTVVPLGAARPATVGKLVTAEERVAAPGRLVQSLLTGTPLLCVDVVALAVAFGVSSIWTSMFGWPGSGNSPLLFGTMCMAVALAFFFAGLYPGVHRHPSEELRKLWWSLSLVFGVFWSTTWLDSDLVQERQLVPVIWALFAVICPLFRGVARNALARCSWWGYPAIVAGPRQEAEAVHAALRTNPAMSLRPVGIVGESLPRQFRGDAPVPYLGPERLAGNIAQRYSVHWAVVTMPNCTLRDMQSTLQRQYGGIPNVLVVTDMAGLPNLCDWEAEARERAGITLSANRFVSSSLSIKRGMEFALAAALGLLSLPCILAIAALIKLTSKGPVFYRSERIGQNGKRLWIWKFRTMVVDAEEILGQHLDADPELRRQWEAKTKLRRDPRVTPLGHWLRKMSLDELPQLWNILQGDLGLVGPRPLLHDDVPKYGKEFETYMSVRPGLTGLWQVSGRNDTTFQQRIDFDRYYIRNWSLWLDVYILARTIKAVISCRGAY